MSRWKACSSAGRVALIMLAIWGIVGMDCGSRAQAETKYTPTVRLSERYDSNVFMGPKSFVPPGRNAWDFATDLSAGVEVLNKSRLGDSALIAQVLGGTYAYNTDLSYVSTYVFGSSDLSKWTNELVPGLKFRVSDSFLYTPETPAFLTGGRPAETSDIFTRGIQAVRANTFTNNLSAQGNYSLSRSVGLQTKYTYSILRVGQIFTTSPAGAPVQFFDATLHTLSAGPTYQLRGRDTLFFQYYYTAAETSGHGTSLKYSAHTVQPEYVTKAVPGYTLTISGGATVIEGAENKPFFSGRLALTTHYDRPTQLNVSLSRQVAPAYFGNGGAIISSVAQLSVSHRFTKVLQLTTSGYYGYGESTPQALFTFTSITGLGSLDYKITRSTTVSLSQEYSRYSYTGIDPFDRLVTMVTLTTAWK